MKKEQYFTDKNLDNKAKQIYEKVKKINNRNKFTFQPKISALLILDMQRYFLDETSHACIPSMRAIIPNISKLISQYKNSNLPVIFTKHTNNNKNASLMSEWWRDIITENSDLSRIIPDLDYRNSIIIDKAQYDAFYNTNLEDILKENNIHQLVITGVMTHLCCDTTIRSAFMKGCKTFFPIDATATYNEEFHISSFINLSHGFTVPVLTKDILES